MRRVQHHAQQKNSWCAVLNPQVAIAAGFTGALFPAQTPPGEYDQTTLKFSGFRKQTAFLTRVGPNTIVFIHH